MFSRHPRDLPVLILILSLFVRKTEACVACVASPIALHPRHGPPLGSVVPNLVLFSAIRVLTEKSHLSFLIEDVERNVDATEDSDVPSIAPEDVSSGAMIGAIGFYKNWISPLLPPACRFLPTCSQYGVQAIEMFGPSKGAILTAWRLMRCTPLGGKGYDPPRWPPVAYNYGSY